MDDRSEPAATYRVLLIGIDAYDPSMALHGCVSDIDSIQRVLLDRAGIPADRITRLVSPHPLPVRESPVPSQPATRENIVAALTALGSDEVGPTERVFVYYAGHGTRRPVAPDRTRPANERTTRFSEALVPVDAGMDGSNVLWDFELNALLARITARTQCVTVILDCCHSSGAVRGSEACGATARFARFGDAPAVLSDDQSRSMDDASKGGGRLDACQVLTACLAHELANEVPREIAEGETRGGLLTRALVTALSEVPDDELRTVPWARLWNRLRELVETWPDVPAQHPSMSGNLARAWLAGPPDDSDAGLEVRARPDHPGEYAIGAGTLAGITPGASLAVYGPTPSRFPPIGSEADLAARLSDQLLEVREASPSTAIAVAPDVVPLTLPAGARGRLVAAGAADRLPCAVVPDEPTVVESLSASPLLEVTTADRALARLERRAEDAWVLTDDVHGARAGDPVLAVVPAQELHGHARPLLEHYLRYAAPLRMVTRCTDLAGALRIDLLQCPSARVADDQIDQLVRIEPAADGTYAIPVGTLFCIRVANTSYETLRVFVFDSAPSGSVGLLGDELIADDSVVHLWSRGEHGVPFMNATPEGADGCIDRLAAIGTTELGADLGHLQERGSFSGAAARSDDDATANAPLGFWTATTSIVRTFTAGA